MTWLHWSTSSRTQSGAATGTTKAVVVRQNAYPGRDARVLPLMLSAYEHDTSSALSTLNDQADPDTGVAGIPWSGAWGGDPSSSGKGRSGAVQQRLPDETAAKPSMPFHAYRTSGRGPAGRINRHWKYPTSLGCRRSG